MSLTDRAFWLSYWESKKDLAFPVPQDFILSNFLKEICSSNSISNSLELGGFPGHYSVYLKKYLGVDPTLLDYVIHPKVFLDVLKANDLKEKDIHVLEADLFSLKSNSKFDLVFSNGLIEHFENTQEIIERHTAFLKEEGKLYISLPNFKGFNGWIQRNFDRENYDKHYIECMDLTVLKKACENLGLKNIRVFYFGRFMIWLENLSTKSIIFKTAFKISWFLLKVLFKIIPVESKWFSPYIVILANK